MIRQHMEALVDEYGTENYRQQKCLRYHLEVFNG
jgi:hypothetical protein